MPIEAAICAELHEPTKAQFYDLKRDCQSVKSPATLRSNHSSQNMKQTLLLLAMAALVGCGEKETLETMFAESESSSGVAGPTSAPPPPPDSKLTIENIIREDLKKPTGKLTKADFEQVTSLNLRGYFLTDLSSLAELTNLENLNLGLSDLTDKQLKSLPKLTKLTELNL